MTGRGRVTCREFSLVPEFPSTPADRMGATGKDAIQYTEDKEKPPPPMSADNPTPRPRTIDERLEGLTQTVEIIAAMQRDNEKRFAANAEAQLANEKRFAEIADDIAGLIGVAQRHERRIAKIDGGEDLSPRE